MGPRNENYAALNSSADEHELDSWVEGRASAHDVATHLTADAGDLSLANPFLVAPDQPLKSIVRPRTSAEWVEQRRIYFSSDAEKEDVESEAREAQGWWASLARNAQQGADKSWVDLGLAAVDGAVDRFGAKIIRWTDDGGKDEALLLPLAKGKRD